jgi:hypothetical protein
VKSLENAGKEVSNLAAGKLLDRLMEYGDASGVTRMCRRQGRAIPSMAKVRANRARLTTATQPTANT